MIPRIRVHALRLLTAKRRARSHDLCLLTTGRVRSRAPLLLAMARARNPCRLLPVGGEVANHAPAEPTAGGIVGAVPAAVATAVKAVAGGAGLGLPVLQHLPLRERANQMRGKTYTTMTREEAGLPLDQDLTPLLLGVLKRGGGRVEGVVLHIRATVEVAAGAGAVAMKAGVEAR